MSTACLEGFGQTQRRGPDGPGHEPAHLFQVALQLAPVDAQGLHLLDHQLAGTPSRNRSMAMTTTATSSSRLMTGMKSGMRSMGEAT